MTEDTLFDMASLTKVLVTTTAILQLYEQHKLDLDTPVAHYLPAFTTTTTPGAPHLASEMWASSEARPPSSTSSAIPPAAIPPPAVIPAEGRNLRIAPSSNPAIPQAIAWKSQITIRQLLTHYSGLPEDIDLKDAWGLAAPDKAEGIRRALAAIPYGPPGLTFKYSDINFITLGYLVETLSGEPLDIYAQDHIFAPLGMNQTRYLPFKQACGPNQIFGSAISLPTLPPYKPGDPVTSIGFPDYACPPTTWITSGIIPQTAPTAHDNEGTPTTNPNYDHILRGTVHDPTTRRMGGVAGHAGVFSTAQDMSLFCQALLDKLTHNTGPFPLKQSTLRLATSPNEPATAVNTATIFTPDGQPTKGVASRGLGWDLNSPFSRPRGEIFPITTRNAAGEVHPGSFGHTGFTGTSLWLDPTSNTYVILLANSIHPHVGASISPLRGQVATAAAKSLGICASDRFRDTGTNVCPKDAICDNVIVTASGGRVRLGNETLSGIDVLESEDYIPLKNMAKKYGDHLRLAILTNQSGLDAHGHRTIDILAHASSEITLVKIFSPEHGLYGKSGHRTPAARDRPHHPSPRHQPLRP